ncbi:hypothetical protein LTR09_008144 [Extremus antarcticus]|uniref:Uncharacterized protein n=1 Tax=Extremus antarcticus TaxID=702011 RepID=A0AAJ0G788_9PEZI|nr:hypothetical protein LTR09_008144 [Extremus antarcticus]
MATEGQCAPGEVHGPAALENRKSSPARKTVRLPPSSISAHAGRPPTLLAPEDRSASWPVFARSQTDTLRRYTQALARRSTKLEEQRSAAQLLRSDLKQQRKKYQQYHRYLEESHAILLDHLDEMIVTDDLVSSREALYKRYGVTRADSIILRRQSGRIQDIEDALDQLEASMTTRETSFKRIAQRIVGIHRRHGDGDTNRLAEDITEFAPTTATPSIDSAEAETDAASSAVSESPPLVLEYRDRAGDMKVMQDRLFALEQEYAETMQNQTMREDQTLEGELPTLYLSPEFETELLQARHDLDVARRAREDARIACLDHGLNPDAQRATTANHDEGPTSEHADVAPEAGDLPNRMPSWLERGNMNMPPEIVLSSNEIEGNLLSDVEMHTPKQDPTDKVEQWMESMNVTPLRERSAGTGAPSRPPLQNRHSYPCNLRMHVRQPFNSVEQTLDGFRFPSENDQDSYVIVQDTDMISPSLSRFDARSLSSSGLDSLKRLNIPHDEVQTTVMQQAQNASFVLHLAQNSHSSELCSGYTSTFTFSLRVD